MMLAKTGLLPRATTPRTERVVRVESTDAWMQNLSFIVILLKGKLARPFPEKDRGD